MNERHVDPQKQHDDHWTSTTVRDQLAKIDMEVSAIASAFVDSDYDLHRTHQQEGITEQKRTVERWEKVRIAVYSAVAVSVVVFIANAVWKSFLAGPQ